MSFHQKPNIYIRQDFAREKTANSALCDPGMFELLT